MSLTLLIVLLLYYRAFWTPFVKQCASPWPANPDVITAFRVRDRFHCQALASGDKMLWQQYCSACN